MDPFQNQDLLEYVVDEYTDFDEITTNSGRSFDEDDDLDSDFEDNFELLYFKSSDIYNEHWQNAWIIPAFWYAYYDDGSEEFDKDDSLTLIKPSPLHSMEIRSPSEMRPVNDVVVVDYQMVVWKKTRQRKYGMFCCISAPTPRPE